MRNSSSPPLEALKDGSEDVQVELINPQAISLTEPAVETFPGTAAPPAPSFSLDDVRAMVKDELGLVQIVTDLRQKVEGQKQIVESLEAQLAALPKLRRAGSGLWPTLLGLLLVAAMGTAGIVLPPAASKAEANTTLMVDTATLYQATGQNDNAMRVLDEAVRTGIKDANTLSRAGELYRVLKAYDKAIVVLTQAVQQEPQNESYLLNLARSYGDAGKHPEAIARYQALIKIDPANAIYYLEMGHIYRSSQNFDQALAQYQKSLEIDPNWQGYFYLGEAYRDQYRYDEAIAQYKNSLEIRPDIYFAWVNSGLSYAGKKDYAQAIKQYQAAIGINPNRAEAYFYTGEAYLAQEAFDQAITSYQQTIEKNGKYMAAYVGLGQAYVELYDCANAVPQFKQALSLFPNNTKAQEGLAICAAQQPLSTSEHTPPSKKKGQLWKPE